MQTLIPSSPISERLENETLARLRARLPHLQAGLVPSSRIEDLRLDSLDVVELLCTVQCDFDVRLSLDDMHSLKTVQDLLDLIARRKS